MPGQIPCSTCWRCSPGSGGTGPATPCEDPAERQSPSASPGGWHRAHAATRLLFLAEPVPRNSTSFCQEGVNQRRGSSSLRFLVLFVHPHRFLGVYCCCELWIMLSMYVWHAEVYSSLTKWFRHTCQPTLKERPNYTTLSVCFSPSLLSFNKLYYYAEYCKKENIKKKHHMPKTSQLSFSFRQCCRGTYSLSKAIELLMQSRMRVSQASLKITEECQIDRRYPCGWQS